MCGTLDYLPPEMGMYIKTPGRSACFSLKYLKLLSAIEEGEIYLGAKEEL